MDANIHMAINQKSWLSPTLFEQLSGYMEFKEYFHHIYIWTRKDPDQKWLDVILEVIKRWLVDWHLAFDEATKTRKFAEKKKKEATKLKV